MMTWASKPTRYQQENPTSRSVSSPVMPKYPRPSGGETHLLEP